MAIELASNGESTQVEEEKWRRATILSVQGNERRGSPIDDLEELNDSLLSTPVFKSLLKYNANVAYETIKADGTRTVNDHVKQQYQTLSNKL
jgi:hypothetical protein